MLMLNIPLLNHEGAEIFSLDIHPSGLKLATAGQDRSGAGLLMVWDISFIRQLEQHDALESCDPDSYGYMAKIVHSKSVNCVRWSRAGEGRRMVAAGDDATPCVYECVGTFEATGSTLLASTSKRSRISENYRCMLRLYGHSMDVTHVDWSPDGSLIASCSLDNTAIVWNSASGEKIKLLRTPGNGMKGLAWDPVGRFLAAQLDGNTLRVWQTDTWECVQESKAPFSESTGSSLFARMDWSADGQYLLCPCAMNNGGPTVRVLNRNPSTGPNKDEDTDARDLVGFRKAVVCVRASPRCVLRDGCADKPITLFATGSRDHTLAVWAVPGEKRPILVLRRLFKQSLLDMAWCGNLLAACSRDGRVRMCLFAERELGRECNDEGMSRHTQALYGLPYPFSSTTPLHHQWGLKAANGSEKKDPHSYHLASHPTVKGAWRKLCRSELAKLALCTTAPKLTSGDGAKAQSTPLPSKATKRAREKRNAEAAGLLFKIRGEDGLQFDTEVVEEGVREVKRLLHTKIPHLPTTSIEVLNTESAPAGGDGMYSSKITCHSNDADTVVWTAHLDQIIIRLTANQHWTAVMTHDGQLNVYSTPTGGLAFSPTIDDESTPEEVQEGRKRGLCACEVLRLEGHYLLAITDYGLVRAWNLLNRKSCFKAVLLNRLFDHSTEPADTSMSTKLRAVSFVHLPNGSDFRVLLSGSGSTYYLSPPSLDGSEATWLQITAKENSEGV